MVFIILTTLMLIVMYFNMVPIVQVVKKTKYCKMENVIKSVIAQHVCYKMKL